MADIDTYLYANGQLRLSIHGAKRGGNVLVYEHDGRTQQCEIEDEMLPVAFERLSNEGATPDRRFSHVSGFIAIPGSVRA